MVLGTVTLGMTTLCSLKRVTGRLSVQTTVGSKLLHFCLFDASVLILHANKHKNDLQNWVASQQALVLRPELDAYF